MKYLIILVAISLLGLGGNAFACGGCNKSSAAATNKAPQTITTTSTVSVPTAQRPAGALPIIRGVASNQRTTTTFSSGFFDSIDGDSVTREAEPRGLGRRERGLRQGGGSLRKPR